MEVDHFGCILASSPITMDNKEDNLTRRTNTN